MNIRTLVYINGIKHGWIIFNLYTKYNYDLEVISSIYNIYGGDKEQTERILTAAQLTYSDPLTLAKISKEYRSKIND